MARGVLIYIIGVPGSGKTTLLSEFERGWHRTQVLEPCPHVILRKPYVPDYAGLPSVIAEIGKDRAAFSGTDALSMSIQPKAIELLALLPYKLVLAEGDRLANAKFFNAAISLGWILRVILLSVSPKTQAERLAKRNSKQDERWLLGRTTKVRNLYRYVHDELPSDHLPAEELAATLAALAEAYLKHELEAVHA